MFNNGYTLMTMPEGDYYVKTLAVCLYSSGNEVKGVKYSGSFGNVVYV
jgi:hypothetical protein